MEKELMSPRRLRRRRIAWAAAAVGGLVLLAGLGYTAVRSLRHTSETTATTLKPLKPRNTTTSVVVPHGSYVSTTTIVVPHGEYTTTSSTVIVPRGSYTTTTPVPRTTLPGDDPRTQAINRWIAGNGMPLEEATCIVDGVAAVDAAQAPGSNPDDAARARLAVFVKCTTTPPPEPEGEPDR